MPWPVLRRTRAQAADNKGAATGAAKPPISQEREPSPVSTLARGEPAAAPTPAKPLLNAKQQQFVGEYLIDLNATQAAIRAGYAPKHADVTGPRLLRNVAIARLVADAMAKRAERTQATADRVVHELARIGFSDLRGMFQDGRLLRLEDAPDELAPAIASLKVVTKDLGEGEVEHTAEIRLWDKVAALTRLMPHVGLKTGDSKLEMTGTLTVEAIRAELEPVIRRMETADLRRLDELAREREAIFERARTPA